MRFQTEEHVLRVNKSKITDENTFNGDHFEIEGKHGLSKDEKTLSWVFLMICGQCFNCEICMCMFFKHCLVFAIFKPFPVGFGS